MKLSLAAMALLVTPLAVSAEVITYDCDFTHRIDEEGKKLESFRLVFRLDTVSRRSIMEGNLGFVDVDLHIGDEAITFAEKVPSGVIQTTTIKGDGIAVHSRNTVILGEFVTGQHHGRCFPK